MIGVILALAISYPPPGSGKLNPDVTQANIASTICSPGWTKTVRPPASYTNRLKQSQLPAGADPRLYEEDHVCPIEDGGHPRDPQNLRPQPWAGKDGARVKDVVETKIHRLICARKITLQQGQDAICIKGDWHDGFRKYVGPLP